MAADGGAGWARQEAQARGVRFEVDGNEEESSEESEDSQCWMPEARKARPYAQSAQPRAEPPSGSSRPYSQSTTRPATTAEPHRRSASRPPTAEANRASAAKSRPSSSRSQSRPPPAATEPAKRYSRLTGAPKPSSSRSARHHIPPTDLHAYQQDLVIFHKSFIRSLIHLCQNNRDPGLASLLRKELVDAFKVVWFRDVQGARNEWMLWGKLFEGFKRGAEGFPADCVGWIDEREERRERRREEGEMGGGGGEVRREGGGRSRSGTGTSSSRSKKSRESKKGSGCK